MIGSAKSVEFRLAVKNSTDHVDLFGIDEIIPRVVGEVGKVGKVCWGSPGVEILEMLRAMIAVSIGCLPRFSTPPIPLKSLPTLPTLPTDRSWIWVGG